MKKFISLMLCLLMCVGVLASCDSLSEEEKGANVRVYLTDYPYTLDPAVVQLNSDVEQILSLIFEPLTTIDADGEIQPALATEWYYDYDEIYQLHKMYFELKVTSWSDNRQVTADDVIYAWRRILSPEVDSPYASLLYCIKGARDVKSGVGTIDDLGLAAVDDTLLEVTFEQEYNAELFAEQVANIHLAPSREDIVTRYEQNGEDWAGNSANIVCNGKFRVQAMDMPRDRKEGEKEFNDKFACKLVLERNAYYVRDPEEDALDSEVLPYRITCYYAEGQSNFYPNEAGFTQETFQASRFNAGELYFLSSFDAQTYASYGDKLNTQQTLNGYAFYFNTADELLKDAKVRKALSLGLDRTAIANAIGTGEVPATGYVPNGVFNTGNEDDFRTAGGNIYNTSADKAGAESLLNGKKGTITITYLKPQNDYTVRKHKDFINYESNSYKLAAEAAGKCWQDLGFKVEYRALEPEKYQKALIERDYQVIGVNVVNGSVDAFSYLAPFAKEYSGAGVVVNNEIASDEEIFEPHYTNYDNADYSKLITDALFCTDRAQRASLLHQAEGIIAEECPATMLFWYSRSYIANDDMVSGYDDDSWFGYIDMGNLKLDDWRAVNESEAILSEARDPKEEK